MNEAKGFKRWHVIVLSIVFTFMTVQIVQAATSGSEPGSDGDPLVTQGYVDSKITVVTQGQSSMDSKLTTVTQKADTSAQLVDQLNQKVTELTALIEAQKQEIEDLKNSPSGAGSGSVYKMIKLEPGKSLIPEEGTEIIVRIGKTKNIKGTGGGMVDSTDGKELTIANTSIAINHSLICTKADGRGIKSNDKATCYIFVRGVYTIK